MTSLGVDKMNKGAPTTGKRRFRSTAGNVTDHLDAASCLKDARRVARAALRHVPPWSNKCECLDSHSTRGRTL
jgi:hypothetical protein